VYCPGGGIVDFVGWRNGYGFTLEIEHGYGLRTIYAHLDGISVKQGQKVKRGDLIATSGNTGKLSTGPTFITKLDINGIALDPRNFYLR